MSFPLCRKHLMVTKIDDKLKLIAKACCLGDYGNKIHDKIDKYFTHESYSRFVITLRLLFFNLKSLFKFTQSYKSEYYDSVCHVLLYPKGGIGDHIYFLKYCYCLRKQFGDTIIIDVLLEEKDRYLKDSLYKYAHYVDSVFENKCPKHDVVIELMRFPEIKNVDLRRIKLLSNSTLIEYLFCVSQFKLANDNFYRSDYLGRWYSQIHRRTRENQSDIEDFLEMSSMADFSLHIDENITRNVLSKFGFSQDSYVILQTGSGRVFQKVKEDTRQWPVEYYQKVVDLLREKHSEIKFIQCGKLCHNRINNVDINLVGKTTLEEVFVLIKSAKLLISAEGGYPAIRHFTSRKVSCVLFGPTDKDFFGFSENLNISSDVCVGCEWINRIWYKKCLLSGDKAFCMKSLVPEMLVTRIEQEGLL